MVNLNLTIHNSTNTVNGESIRWGKLSLDSLVVASAKVSPSESFSRKCNIFELKKPFMYQKFFNVKARQRIKNFVRVTTPELLKWTTQGGTIARPNPLCAFVPESFAKINYLIPNFINFLQTARSLLKGYSVKQETIDWY